MESPYPKPLAKKAPRGITADDRAAGLPTFPLIVYAKLTSLDFTPGHLHTSNLCDILFAASLNSLTIPPFYREAFKLGDLAMLLHHYVGNYSACIREEQQEFCRQRVNSWSICVLYPVDTVFLVLYLYYLDLALIIGHRRHKGRRTQSSCLNPCFRSPLCLGTMAVDAHAIAQSEFECKARTKVD